jgi:hypothetical protein
VVERNTVGGAQKLRNESFLKANCIGGKRILTVRLPSWHCLASGLPDSVSAVARTSLPVFPLHRYEAKSAGQQRLQ